MSIESLENLLSEVQTVLMSRRSIPDYVQYTKVCERPECKCFFSYKGALQETPKFNPAKLVIWGLDCQNETFDEIRSDLINAMNPFKGKIFIHGKSGYAEITLNSHAVAANVQHKLHEIGYNINFFCSNMRRVRGISSDSEDEK